MSALTTPIANIAAAGMTNAANVASNAATNAANVFMNKETNYANRQIANETNAANLAINQSTNETNVQLQREQNQWNQDQWERNNEYNSPVEQMKRLQAAGLNPLSFSGFGNGNSSAPAATTAPAIVNPAELIPGAPMNPSHVDPLTLDGNISASIIDSFNANTNRQTAESNINLNHWSVKSVSAQTEKILAEKDILLAQLPYAAEQAAAVLVDTRSSARLKDANQKFINVQCQQGASQIYATCQKVLQDWYSLEIDKQNADTNTANALTAQERAQNDFKVARAQFEHMSVNQFIQWAEKYKITKTDTHLNSSTANAENSGSNSRNGSIGFNAGSSSQSGLSGSAAAGLASSNSAIEGISRSNSDTQTDVYNKVNNEKAKEEFTQYCAASYECLDRLGQYNITPQERKALISLSNYFFSRIQSDLHGHQVKAALMARRAEVIASMAFPVDGYSNESTW